MFGFSGGLLLCFSMLVSDICFDCCCYFEFVVLACLVLVGLFVMIVCLVGLCDMLLLDLVFIHCGGLMFVSGACFGDACFLNLIVLLIIILSGEFITYIWYLFEFAVFWFSCCDWIWVCLLCILLYGLLVVVCG